MNSPRPTQRLLPEWAPVRAVALAWPYPHGDWCNNFEQVQHCYWYMLEAISQCAEVWLLLHPSISEQSWRSSCPGLDIRWGNLSVHHDIAYDDTWIRDYGPLSTSAGYLMLQFNGWGGKYPAQLDNEAAAKLLTAHDLEQKQDSFVGEGGALETDGHVLLMNKDCVVDSHRNPAMDLAKTESHLRDLFGYEKLIWLEGINLTGDDTDGHIDTMARFADVKRVIYSGRNPEHCDCQALSKLHGQLTALASTEGWQLFELPTPQISSQIDGRVLPATYANFLIVNDAVVAPMYGVDEDQQAMRVLAAAFPQFRLLPVRCEALLEQHGSLHCATMQIARL